MGGHLRSIAVVLACACGRINYEELDAGMIDAGMVDAGPRDGGMPVDAPILPDTGTDAGPPPPPYRIDAWYWHGANLPWRTYGYDFGSVDGAASVNAQTEIGPAFQAARDGGMRIVRWAMFTSADIPFTVDVGGIVDGFEPGVFTDLDAAIDLATTYDVYLMMVVFSDAAPGDPLLANPAQRQGVAAAVASLAAHAVTRGDRVLSWSYWPGRSLSAGNVTVFASTLATEIHAVGAGFDMQTLGLDDAAAACDLGADFTGIADFDSPPACAICTTRAEIGATYAPSCPVIVDVAFANDPVNALMYLTDIYDRGYAGAIAWSLLPARTFDLVPIDIPSALAFSTSQADIGPP